MNGSHTVSEQHEGEQVFFYLNGGCVCLFALLLSFVLDYWVITQIDAL